MILMHKQTIIPISDLRYLAVECGDCHAQIRIDLEGPNLELRDCPVCHREFDQDATRHIGMLSSAYRYRKDSKHKFSFLVQDE
jgi:hypothetical protein